MKLMADGSDPGLAVTSSDWVMVNGVDEPTPDRKDWTWALERACDSCGLEVDHVARSDLGALIRANAAAWRALLARGSMVAARPPAGSAASPVWSALEYGCHVRDVYRRFHERLRRMLSEDQPSFADWDQNYTAIEAGYGEQDPGRVSYDLALIAGQTADMVDRIMSDQWERTGTRSDGLSFTVDSLVRYLLHDVVHHVWDVEQGFEDLLAGPYAEEGDDDPTVGSWADEDPEEG